MNILLVITALFSGVGLDQEANWNQMPYAPADGETVSVNPPPFTWVPTDNESVYVLEVAQDESFEVLVYQCESTHVSTVSLNTPLDPGSYCWRYGLKEEDGIAYSKIRSFVVPEDAQLWPRPSAASMIANVPQRHPRLFVLSEEVAVYRERAASGDLQRVLGSIIRQCDKHLGEVLVAEPPPVTGKGAERGLNYAKIFWETRPPMNLMETCALAYILTGDTKYGDEAKRRILYFFADWDPEGTTSYRHNDEPAMWMMMRGIRAYDWTYDLFTVEERNRVEPVMRVRAAQFYEHLRNRRRFHTNPYESHAGRTLGFLGEAALAFAHDWPEAEEWLDYVTTCFWNIYPAWGKDDGGWHEGPGYWSAYMDFALHFIVPLKIATGAELIEKPFFRNTPYYLLYSNPPYARISPFGDGENATGGGGGKGTVMFAFSSLLDDPYLRWYAEESGVDIPAGILGVVLSREAPVAKSPVDLPQSRCFPGVGLLSLHTALGIPEEDVHFLIHSDPYGAISHAHADQNAFTLEAYGEALAIASGYYPWYGSEHHSQWQWESKSSNTITFNDGIGQVKRSAKSFGSIECFVQNDDFDYVQADAVRAYQDRLSKCVRHVVHVRPGVFVICDEVAAPEPVIFEWRLHGNSAVITGDNTMRIVQEDAALDLHFIVPEELSILPYEGAEPPPEKEYPTQYYAIAATPKPVAETTFLTVLVPTRTGTAATTSVVSLSLKNGVGVRVTVEGTKSLVAFSTGDIPLELEGNISTGTVLAIRLDDQGIPSSILQVE
ncbi:MAG: DUF4962 domain-containing protein [Candidatus Hydrogenedentes bacterium]|nr:DUF4962 domain-containing protein [Candidatus Hydrogenedentota bacterium]